MSTPETTPVGPGIRAFWEATYAAVRELPDPCTRRELAAALGRAVTTLIHWNSKGTGPRVTHVIVGTNVIAHHTHADVLAWLDSRDQTTTTYAS